MEQQPESLPRGERTRQAILDAAEALFIARGYNGTSMRQIARAARIALGGIYNHFSGKEDIFRALLRDRIPYPRMAEALRAIEDSSGPQMLAEAFDRVQEIAQDYSTYFTLAITDVREFDGGTVRVLAQEMIPEMARFVARAQAAGGLRADVAPFIFLRMFVSLMVGYMFTEMVGYLGGQPLMPGLPASREARAGMIELLLNGITDRQQG